MRLGARDRQECNQRVGQDIKEESEVARGGGLSFGAQWSHNRTVTSPIQGLATGLPGGLVGADGEAPAPGSAFASLLHG